MEALLVMSQNKPVWLTKYPDDIFFAVKGSRLNAYAVALEGWRRGLTLKFYSPNSLLFNESWINNVDRAGELFSLSDEGQEYFFFQSQWITNAKVAIDICKDKLKMKHILDDANVPTMEESQFGNLTSEYYQVYVVDDKVVGSIHQMLSPNITDRQSFVTISQPERITKEIKKMAIKAVKAIPNLTHGAVNFTLDLAQVIDITPTADIAPYLFPDEGKATDIPEAIIDFYFPKSVNIEWNSPVLYFPFKENTGLLENDSLESITVSHLPVGALVKTAYHLKGRVTSKQYKTSLIKWARAQRNLSGYITTTSYRSIKVVIVTNSKDTLKEFENFIKTIGNKIVIEKVTNYDQNKPIQVGFTINSNKKEFYQIKQQRYLYQFIRIILIIIGVISSTLKFEWIKILLNKHKIEKRR